MQGARLAALAGLLWPCWGGAAHAAESEPTQSPRASVSLISDVDAVRPGQRFRVGLWQRLAPHWHTYWKNPGDAGTASSLELTLPPGAEASGIAWPAPARIPAGPVMSFGYEDAVVLPVHVTVPRDARAGDSFVVEAAADWLVCKEDCIPEEGRFRLELPIVDGGSNELPAAAAPVRAAFAESDARAPATLPGDAHLAVEGDALSLRVTSLAAPGSDAFFFPETWGAVVHAAPQAAVREGDTLSLAMARGPAFDPATPLAGVLAVLDGEGHTRWFQIPGARAASTAAPAPAATTPKSAPESDRTSPPPRLAWWQALAFALLGGLLLNLMPCVFPVLAIKANALLRLGRDDRQAVRQEALWYTAGVLVAFAALAGALLALRASGEVVGWGFQFQSPGFVAAMAWLLLAVGLNLSGVYEIGLGVGGVGDRLTERPGWAGSFFTGLLAVVVATPCTAPFMGAALGAALLAPAATCVGIFLGMGVGLALPYTLLGLLPDLARRLPRPGPWMVRLRQALAFPMYGSAAWLLWVLARQAGEAGLRIALAGALLTSLACWLWGWRQQGARRSGWLLAGAVLAVVGVGGLWSGLETPSLAPASAATGGPHDAQAFTPARLSSLRAEGHPVFVNMTADWCLTCLVNERTTLGSERVQAAMRDADVTYLKGDWTRRDPDITAYLHAFERDGVPFYAVYPADGKPPEVLPSVLTIDQVLDALQRASATATSP